MNDRPVSFIALAAFYERTAAQYRGCPDKARPYLEAARFYRSRAQAEGDETASAAPIAPSIVPSDRAEHGMHHRVVG